MWRELWVRYAPQFPKFEPPQEVPKSRPSRSLATQFRRIALLFGWQTDYLTLQHVGARAELLREIEIDPVCIDHLCDRLNRTYACVCTYFVDHQFC